MSSMTLRDTPSANEIPASGCGMAKRAEESQSRGVGEKAAASRQMSQCIVHAMNLDKMKSIHGALVSV